MVPNRHNPAKQGMSQQTLNYYVHGRGHAHGHDGGGGGGGGGRGRDDDGRGHGHDDGDHKRHPAPLRSQVGRVSS
jgi:hypothetical protein